MKKLIITLSCVGALFCWASADQKKLLIVGSSTIAPLASELAKKFESLHPGLRIDVHSGGSSRGILDARAGTAEIGMVSRALTSEESDLIPALIAKDGICMILNKANKVDMLTDEQIVNIYTGKITNWKEVGGIDSKITVVSKVEGRSTLELFTHHFKLKNSDIKAAILIGDNEQEIKTVAGNALAIGYVSIGSAEFNEKSGVKIKLLPMNSIKATVENVKNAKFPLSRDLNFVTKAVPQGLAKEFIDFSQSKAANAIIEGQYFVPIKE